MKILQTFDNLDYELTEQQAENIMQASIEGKTSGIWIGKDYIAFASIKGITDLPEKVNNYPQLPAKGYMGIINSSPNRGLEAMARGLKKFIAKNPNSSKAKSLLEKMRLQYAKKNKQKQMA